MNTELRHRLDRTDAYIAAGLFAVSTLIYGLTLAKSVAFGDSGELTAAAFSLGVAHPPGYPLYTLLGKLMIVLTPFGDAATAMNLFSALAAAGTTAVIYGIARTLGQDRAAGVVAAGMAAFGASFWSQAVIAEVYGLASLLLSLLVLTCLRAYDAPQKKTLMWAALAGGLAMTHHITTVLYFPLLLGYLFCCRSLAPLKTHWRRLVMCFLLPLVLYAYLPLASLADPINDWGNPENLSALFDHVSAKQFRGHMLAFGMAGVVHQSGFFLDFAGQQWPLILLLLVPLGLFWGLSEAKRASLLLLAMTALNLIYTLAYFITDIEAYFIPTFLIWALFAGFGAQAVLRGLERFVPARVATVAVVLLALLPVWGGWSRSDMSDHDLAAAHAHNLLDPLPENAVLFLAHEADLFLVNFLKVTEDYRPDVDVYDVRQNIHFIPAKREGKEVDFNHFKRFLGDLMKGDRPIFFSDVVFTDLPMRPWGLLFELQKQGRAPTPAPDYDLSALEQPYDDAASQTTVAKYYLAMAARAFSTVEADALLERALKAAPEAPHILMSVGDANHRGGKLDRARALFQRAAEADPFNPDIHGSLGMLAMQTRQFEQALSHFEDALKLREGDPKSLVNRAATHEQIGDAASDRSKKLAHYNAALRDLKQVNNPQLSRAVTRLEQKISALR